MAKRKRSSAPKDTRKRNHRGDIRTTPKAPKTRVGRFTVKEDHAVTIGAGPLPVPLVTRQPRITPEPIVNVNNNRPASRPYQLDLFNDTTQLYSGSVCHARENRRRAVFASGFGGSTDPRQNHYGPDSSVRCRNV